MNMRKSLLATLAVAVVAAGAFAREYKIGDTGPGGGTVFLIEDGKTYEVSETLGEGTWARARSACSGYRGGGYDNWRMPTKRELDLIYKNLDVDEIDDIESDSPLDIYWSSNGSANSGNGVWVKSFYNGYSGRMDAYCILEAVAVRSF